jgi:hypothetical protein
MALTKIVTKAMPTKNTVGYHVIVKDDGVTVIDRDFMEHSQRMTPVVEKAITKAIQEEVEEYKACKAEYDS